MIEIILIAALIIMIILRAFGIMIPWIWIFAPLWIPLAGFIVIAAAAYLPAAWTNTTGLIRYFKEKRKRRKWHQ